jgi:hypothetical protein
MTLQEIRQRKAARTAEARAIVAKAESEKRQLTAEESANFATIRADIESLEQAEQRQQFLDYAERCAAGVTVIAGNGGDIIAALESRVSLMRVLQLVVWVEPEAIPINHCVSAPRDGYRFAQPILRNGRASQTKKPRRSGV